MAVLTENPRMRLVGECLRRYREALGYSIGRRSTDA
jgi:hypothetical protein